MLAWVVLGPHRAPKMGEACLQVTASWGDPLCQSLSHHLSVQWHQAHLASLDSGNATVTGGVRAGGPAFPAPPTLMEQRKC